VVIRVIPELSESCRRTPVTQRIPDYLWREVVEFPAVLLSALKEEVCDGEECHGKCKTIKAIREDCRAG
jgi:hypothetical protein